MNKDKLEKYNQNIEEIKDGQIMLGEKLFKKEEIDIPSNDFAWDTEEEEEDIPSNNFVWDEEEDEEEISY
jgi:hypothetical protein